MIRSDQIKSYLQELIKLNKYNFIACGYQQLTVSSTAVALTIPTDAVYAIVEVESSLSTPAIRYLELGDGTLPTATTGIRRSNLDAIDITGYQNLSNFRAIQVGAGTHKLNIQYYK
jgi:hypothetical protein